MFVICTRVENDKQRAMVNRCVGSVANLHPREKIVVVDSASPDKSYFEDFRKETLNVTIEDVDNLAYEAGAWWHAYNKYPNEETYCFIQDGLILKESIEEFFPKGDEAFVFSAPLLDSGWTTGRREGSEAWAMKMEPLCDYDLSGNRFRLAIWNCFLATRNTMKQMKTKRLNKILPNCKVAACAYERIWGLALKQEGCEIKSIPKKYFHKCFGGRQ